MIESRPHPLTPADCNLRGMEFVPLQCSVLQSTLFGTSTGDEFKAAFALWVASWHEVPAASLPRDDEMLAFLSKSKKWKAVREKALRGWVECSDGRLYHKVMAEQALAAWERRLDYRETTENKNERQKRWRERCKQLAEQLRKLGVTPPRGASLEALETLLVDAQASTQASTVDAVETGKTGTVRETVTGTVTVIPNTLSGGAAPAPAPPAAKKPATPKKPKAPATAKDPAPTAKIWEAYATAYELRYNEPPVRNGRVNGLLAQLLARLGAEEAHFVAAFYLTITNNQLYTRSCHDVSPLVRDAETLRMQWKTKRPTQAAAPMSARAQRMALASPRLAAKDPAETVDVEVRNVAALAHR